MKLLALVFVVFASACGADKPDPPEQAARKAGCRELQEHLFRISPQGHARLEGKTGPEQAKEIERFLADVPVEDIAQCATADAKVIACMQAASDVAAVRACVPPEK